MIRQEEIALIEKLIRSMPEGQVESVASLKRSLSKGLHDFEEQLKTLPANIRKAALSLFLQRIRETAIEFHIGVVKMALKNELQAYPTKEKASELLIRFSKGLDSIADLYRLH